MYVSGDYQVGRRWFAGARYDRSDRADRRVARRHRRLVPRDLLAERVQPGARAVPPHELRGRSGGQRAPVSVPVFHRGARRASVLGGSSLGSGFERLQVLSHEKTGSIVLMGSPALLVFACRRARARAGQAERHDDDRGSRVDRAGGRRRSHHRRGDRQGLSGSALRRGEAELHPQAAEGRRARRRRARAGDRLAAAAHSAEPQREDPAGRRRVSRRVADGADSRGADRPGHARDGRRPPARQPALLAGSGERQADREGDRRQVRRSSGRTTARSSSSGWPTSPRASTRPKSGGSRRWRPTRAPRW